MIMHNPAWHPTFHTRLSPKRHKEWRAKQELHACRLSPSNELVCDVGNIKRFGKEPMKLHGLWQFIRHFDKYMNVILNLVQRTTGECGLQCRRLLHELASGSKGNIGYVTRITVMDQLTFWSRTCLHLPNHMMS